MYEEYEYITKDILNDKEFIKIELEKHHGTNRLIHSKRVSYESYKICKILGLDYIAAARAGLLHDFFINKKKLKKKERIKRIFTHPSIALKNSKKHFYLNDKEQDIIVSHMFPIGPSIPKYIESWIVSIVDKIVATYEFVESFCIKNAYTPNPYLLLIVQIFN